MFFFARITQLWLAAAPLKAPDELAALGLDRRPSQPRIEQDIRAKKNIGYELTQPQKLLTSTGLLMEGPSGTGLWCYKLGSWLLRSYPACLHPRAFAAMTCVVTRVTAIGHMLQVFRT